MARRGFTLIETLIAIGLLAILLGLLFTFWTDLTRTRVRIDDHIADQRGLRVGLSRLATDLDAATIGGPRHGSGFEGDERGLKLLTRGLDLDRAARGGTDGFGDLQRREYRFDPNADEFRVRSGSASGGAGPWSVLATGIGDIRFRYHAGGAWTTSHDAGTAGRLPTAVEIAVWLVDPDPDSEDEAEDGPGRGDEVEPPDSFFSDEGYDDLADLESPPEASGFEFDEPGGERPPPDRVRVFLVPDAGNASDGAGGTTP